MVYCNYPPGSEQCEAVWQGGVEDTIIKLPHHVGEGPFARIVSMKLAGEDYPLPLHHLKHRSLDGLHENPVYEVKVDYNFHLARQDRGPVQMRVDYTNLLGYWDELTNSEASDSKPSRIKRAITNDGKLDMRRFRDRVRRGEKTDKRLKRRNAEVIKTTVPIEGYPIEATTDVSDNESKLDKRWWGVFRDWLKKLTTVRKGEKGDLPLQWADEINLFKASWGCPGRSWSANLRMDLQAEVTMQATYAYYFSGTFIPPSKPDVFFYFGIEPEATVMLKLTGNAEMRYQSERKRIIDTIGYPGLAVKGIAAVGPTLDIYGQVSKRNPQRPHNPLSFISDLKRLTIYCRLKDISTFTARPKPVRR
jgi:chitinase